MRYLLREYFDDDLGIENWSSFWLVLGDFLDSFKLDPNPVRLEEEPRFSTPIMSAFLAASAEKLAYDNDLDVPIWVFRKKYYLADPYFAGGFKGDYNIFLLRESPPEFRVRNLFVSENVLSRC